MLKKMMMAAVLAVVALAAPARAQELTVGQALDVTAGLNQLTAYESVDKDGKPFRANYKFSADVRFRIALNIDAGRRLQTQVQTAQNDLVMSMVDPATGKVPETKQNALNVEVSKLMTAPARSTLHRIKRSELNLDDNPIPAPVLSLIVPIVDLDK